MGANGTLTEKKKLGPKGGAAKGRTSRGDWTGKRAS